MNLWKSTEKKLTSKEILDHASKCKPEKLENLLNQIQKITEQSKDRKVRSRSSKSKNNNHK